MSLFLATINTDAPVVMDYSDAKIEAEEVFYNDNSYQFYKKLELKNLLNRFDTSKKAPEVNREDLATVAKLAAILRMADALDRSYCQKIKNCRISISEQTLVINVLSKMDISLESWTFDRKSEFFEEVFGLKPVLQRVDRL